MEFNRQTIWKKAAMVANLVFVILVGVYSFKIGKMYAEELTIPSLVQLSWVIFFIAGCSAMVFAMLSVYRIDRRQKWLINVVNWNIRQLRKHELDSTAQTTEGRSGLPPNEEIAGKTIWPWGTHHTKSLGDLEAAAYTLWTLYDPSDPSTAPTNNMVADWLVTERGVSKDKARAMASILRADGLPAGPRR